MDAQQIELRRKAGRLNESYRTSWGGIVHPDSAPPASAGGEVIEATRLPVIMRSWLRQNPQRSVFYMARSDLTRLLDELDAAQLAARAAKG